MFTDADHRVADLARRQHHVFTRDQAFRAGLSPDQVQFEDDRRRDDEAVATGWRPLRFTWKMLHHEVDWVWAKVAGARHHAQLDRGRAA